MKPFRWVTEKLLEDFISKKVKPVSDKIDVFEKENISLNHRVDDQKERILKLEDKLRDCEIKVASFESAFAVMKMMIQQPKEVLINNDLNDNNND